MRNWIVEEEESKRMDIYISEILDISRSRVQKMIDQGIVLLNGREAKSSEKIINQEKD